MSLAEEERSRHCPGSVEDGRLVALHPDRSGPDIAKNKATVQRGKEVPNSWVVHCNDDWAKLPLIASHGTGVWDAARGVTCSPDERSETRGGASWESRVRFAHSGYALFLSLPRLRGRLAAGGRVGALAVTAR